MGWVRCSWQRSCWAGSGRTSG
uniref:Uncharacterized protein n=1 Tax=Arundo donax TaxID=35708 RepID=A0A0A9BTE3_ARUDO